MEENKVLTSEEIIKRIEMAPVAMQTMVAKAFIREDIPNENIQYLFNEDSMEEMNEDSTIENINVKEPEGIGAVEFSMRTSKPSRNNNFITTGAGGWNTCIKGYPMDANANVLANCVGYASGRFNEIINNARGTSGCTYRNLNCNAIDFIEKARAAGLRIGSTPKRGAIVCWGNSGAGHVGIVERVDSNNQVYTSESNYGGIAFCNCTRNNNNGRWGLNANYYFGGFIYLPDDVQAVVDRSGSTPSRPAVDNSNGYSGKFNIGDRVIINGPLYASSTAVAASGNVSNKITNITRVAANTAHPYNTTGDLGWMNENSISKYNEPVPQPAPTPDNSLHVGDTVKIVGTGNGSSYGNSNTAYGIGWTRQILRIWDGRPCPYQVGNGTGTTGFYPASSLQKQ